MVSVLNHTPPWQSVGHLLRERAEKSGDKVFLQFEGTEVSFSEVESRTNQLANVLSDYGVQKGERVAVMMPNSIDFPVSWLAIIKLGAVMVPINTQYQEADLVYTLNNSGTSFALAGEDQAVKLTDVRDRCPELKKIAVLNHAGRLPYGVVDFSQELYQAPKDFDLTRFSQNDLANIQYTSGTTGFPKGCMLTHEYWLRLGQAAADCVQIRDDDMDLTAQPFYYMDPQWNTILCMIAGIPLVVLPRFSASTFWKSVKENGVTFFYVIGTMPVYLLKQPENPEYEKNHNVRLVMCSGIVPQLHETFESRWNVPWREAFGMTETGVDLYVPLDDVNCVGSGAVGKPIHTKEAMIADENGKELPDGETGELVVRGKPMMLGYYADPEATAETIRNGWLHTGDLAYRDVKGYYHIVGRLKDMIRRSGENISTVEVEAILCEHPAVRAAAVLPVTDELRGEEVKAFIQLREGDSRTSVNPQEIIDFTKEKLASFKVPRFIEYVKTFPLTPSERIAKHRLLEQNQDQRMGTYDSATGKWS